LVSITVSLELVQQLLTGNIPYTISYTTTINR